MTLPLALVIAGPLAIVAVVLVAIVWWTVARGHRVGNRGVVQRSRLTCSRCGGTFDYDWVPGAALTAVRLGRGRYLRCPLCRRWSYFDLLATMRARDGGSAPAPAGAPTPSTASPRRPV
ncbi:MAG TPA: hypothetical protein VMG36_02105 [Thermoplasmata archaeon]|nr:hypothetical protein [Thermoplasmata archaeon]